MNTQHRLQWQCRDAPVSSWHTGSCRRNLASYPLQFPRCLIRGLDPAPPFCHAPEPPQLCVRFPSHAPRLCCQICCKISGHRHELAGVWQILCTGLTEWPLQKTQVIARGECCGHGCQTKVVFWIRRCRTHRPPPDIRAQQTHPDPLPRTYLTSMVSYTWEDT